MAYNFTRTRVDGDLLFKDSLQGGIKSSFFHNTAGGKEGKAIKAPLQGASRIYWLKRLALGNFCGRYNFSDPYVIFVCIYKHLCNGKDVI